VTGKPLDCVGVDPAKTQVGKHDFQPSTTDPIVHGVGQVPAPNPEEPQKPRDE
jgi:hypothetical protein